jgi:hypothetical protein
LYLLDSTGGTRRFFVRIASLAAALLLLLSHNATAAGADAGAEKPLPFLDLSAPNYRTPLAGEGFRTVVFGRDVTVQPRNRRSVSAWDLGLQASAPEPEDSGFIPFGSLYFWRHPDDRTLLRAEVVGVYDDIFFSKSSPRFAPFEGVLTFTNFTVPVAQSELVDGESLERQELLWGYVRPGFGIGLRRQVAPGRQENMFALDLTAEPGFLYFDDGSKTSENFVVPRDTFEIRGHLQMRWDALERNLLELPHRGFAAGFDLVYGHRAGWEDWGINGGEAAGDGQDYLSFTGYLLGAGGVPLVDSDRHRLIGSLHVGVGHNLDRFSAPRVGGGPDPMGEEYGSTWRPVLPGAVIQEFIPDHYVLAIGEYRWEPVFFTYLSLRTSLAWLDRQRLEGDGSGTYRKNGLLESLGARVTTGFFYDTRLQLDYNYNFAVIRNGDYGGSEVVLHISKNF